MFKALLKQVIDKEILEDYKDMVSRVTLCSGSRLSSSSDPQTWAVLRDHVNISWRRDLYELRKASPCQNLTLWCVNQAYFTIRRYKQTHPQKYRLEDYAQSVPYWKGWTDPGSRSTRKKRIAGYMRRFIVACMSSLRGS